MKINIVGAGAAGVSVLDALSLKNIEPGSVAVFEGSPSWWRGRAYQPDLDAVRVNAPPMLMSIRHSDPQHYDRWRVEHGHETFVPRSVYGDYLTWTAENTIARLSEGGWDVEVINQWATSFDPARHTVLCVGGGRPLDHYGLAESPGFTLEPYPLANSLEGVPPDSHVAVIGSGLTAVDIAVALATRSHTGPITLLSRSGVLPAVQQHPRKIEFNHLTGDNLPSTLTGLIAAMRTELGADFAALADEFTVIEDPLVRLRRQLSEVDAPGLGRRKLTAAIHMLGSLVWRQLPTADRILLRDRHFRLINSLASPMIPDNAAAVLRMFDSGQLRLLSGVSTVEPAAVGFQITGGSAAMHADIVLNAVNPAVHGIPSDTAVLTTALLSAGVAGLPSDGGLESRSGTLHTLGGITAGTSFVAPSIPTIAAGATALVAKLA